MAHNVTLIPGDGTGPEIAEATRRVLEATGVEFDWDVQDAGADVTHEHGGNPLPDSVLDSIRRTQRRDQGPDHDAGRHGLPLRQRRAAQGRSTCTRSVRPCKTYAGVRSRYDDVDLVIVRENTEDLYAGIEFEEGTERCDEIVATDRAARRARGSAPTSGISIKPISITGSERIVRFAFEYARRERPPQGHGGAQGEHHEAHRRPLPARRPRGRRGVPGHRVRGPHRRQHVHAARAEARAVRRAGAAEPVRRHRLGPRRRAGRRARASRRARTIGDGRRRVFEPTHGSAPKYAGPEQGQPDGHDALAAC